MAPRATLEIWRNSCGFIVSGRSGLFGCLSRRPHVPIAGEPGIDLGASVPASGSLEFVAHADSSNTRLKIPCFLISTLAIIASKEPSSTTC